jgi:copper homeostasis protein
VREIVLEVCVEDVAACMAAREGGAARLEVCSALEVGGLTPAFELACEAMRNELPVHVMVRPRAGDFVYSDNEFVLMLESIDEAKALGADGVVFGVLRADRTVDVERTRMLVERARPMLVTFHRAFDETVRLDEALEDVIAVGCDRVLTSGGEPDVLTGMFALARLVEQARGRIAVAVGGGLRLKDAARLARVTGATHFHGSITEGLTERLTASSARVVDPVVVRRMLELLQSA